MAKDLYEDILKKALKAARRPLSTRKLASKTRMSWPTAKIKLNSMRSRGILTRTRMGSKNLWKLPSIEGKMFQIPKPKKKN